MGAEVYANGRSVSCKSADGKSICAFPDVCLTPPPPPAGPIPIPYPNTGMASDTTDGSKSVTAKGKEVMLKNKSYFKKSMGDEAATKAQGMGVVTHQIQGKVYFVAWSMDVKFEGENVVRHLDMTTHNHASGPTNTPPWLHADQMALATDPELCKKQEENEKKACESAAPHPSGKGLACDDDCKKAKACVLTPKDKPTGNDKKWCCHPDTTGHHLVEVHCFTPSGGRGKGKRLPGMSKYNDKAAPCVCASQARDDGTHGVLHAVQGQLEGAYSESSPVLATFPGAGRKSGSGHADAVSHWNYGQARDAGAFAHKQAFPHCNAECTRQALDDYHKNQCGLNDDTPVRTDPHAEGRSAGDPSPEVAKAISEEAKRISGVSSASGMA